MLTKAENTNPDTISAYFCMLAPPQNAPKGFAFKVGRHQQAKWKSQNQERFCYGIVEYANPLSFDLVFKYHLIPADPTENARYTIFLFAGQHIEDVNFYIQEYMKKNAFIPEIIKSAISVLKENDYV